MAETVEAKIYQVLVAAAQTVTLPSGVSIVLPGQIFTPAATSKFVSVEVHFNRSIETDVSLSLDPIRQGFMRTNVLWPKGSAIVDAYELAGKLRAAFNRGSKLYRDGIQVRIDEDPEIASLITGDSHHMAPVTIRWRSYPQVPA